MLNLKKVNKILRVLSKIDLITKAPCQVKQTQNGDPLGLSSDRPENRLSHYYDCSGHFTPSLALSCTQIQTLLNKIVSERFLRMFQVKRTFRKQFR